MSGSGSETLDLAYVIRKAPNRKIKSKTVSDLAHLDRA